MSTTTKVIRLSSNHAPNVTDLEYERERVVTVTSDLLNRFPSEHNTNTLYEALDALEDYMYVPLEYTITPGRYARYLNTSNAHAMVLKTGGFVVQDNAYTVTLRNAYGVFRVNKRNNVWFARINEQDKFRINFNNV